MELLLKSSALIALHFHYESEENFSIYMLTYFFLSHQKEYSHETKPNYFRIAKGLKLYSFYQCCEEILMFTFVQMTFQIYNSKYLFCVFLMMI